MKVKYFIYESPESPHDERNKIRYFVDNENCYNRKRGYRNYVPYREYKQDLNADARVTINKKYLTQVTEEEIILDLLTQ